MFLKYFLIQGRLDEWLGYESEKDISISLLLGSGLSIGWSDFLNFIFTQKSQKN